MDKNRSNNEDFRPADSKERSQRRIMVSTPGIRGGSSRVYQKKETFPKLYKQLIALGAGLLLLIIVIAVIASRGGKKGDGQIVTAQTSQPEITAAPALMEELLVQDEIQPGTETESGEGEVTDFELASSGETAEDNGSSDPYMPQDSVFAAAATSASSGAETWKSGALAPEPEGEGYLPVFRKAETEEKVIAITVDDCFQTENLKEIISLAQNAGGKLTIFPIGRLTPREALQETLRQAHTLGFEIENHTWSHSALYNVTDAELPKEIFDQDRAIDYILGVNYQSHFLRPRGGDDRNDLRTHAYLQQIGYYGVAHWSISGSGSSIEKLKETIGPGELYLFHCTDDDLAKLKVFIPYAVSQGYKLLTMNELFGYQKNAETALTDDPLTRPIPALEPYERDYKTIKKPTYSYAVYEIQVKLKELGFIEDEPDGIYGGGTETAVKNWQESIGVKADGVLTAELQHRLLD